MAYPVEAVLPDLLANLNDTTNAVLIAPPGAGKTTLVAPAMLNQDWCEGQILLLSPRRLAARMAAERIAAMTNESLGGAVGYATRMDSKQSAETRILVLTEGIFRNRIIADPELAGVSAVLFDEVHERSIDSDFGLALALEAQAAFRPDLRLVAMSATLDGERFSGLMDNAPVTESDGKAWPLDLRYVGRSAEQPIEKEVARVVRRALADDDGDILVFLPGAREIARTAENLATLPEHIIVHPLHGQIDPKAQREAVRPDPSGRRKVILATNIAETSLTIDGVRIVVDSGLARRACYDRAAGVTRLVTERASMSAATQRAGRAARQASGIAYRLWEEAGNGGLPSFDPPEILESDLAPLLLDCAIWWEGEPANLRWLDTPPEAGISEARKRLERLDALDEEGRITPHGEALAKLPLPPELAHMLIKAAEIGKAQLAADIALLLGERGLGGGDVDIDTRLRKFEREGGPRAHSAKAMAKGWSALASKLASRGETLNSDLSTGAVLALAYPDRLAKRRDTSGENWASLGGRGFRLDPQSPLCSSDWLAIANVQGAASGARIISAAAVAEEEILELFAEKIETHINTRFDADSGSIKTEAVRRLGAITLSKSQNVDVDNADIVGAFLGGIRKAGVGALNFLGALKQLRERAEWAGLEQLSDNKLMENLELWLAPLLAGKRRIGDIGKADLHNALLAQLGWDGQQQMERLAPKQFASPAGTHHEIDYSAEAGPTVELRVQALYGLNQHPVIGEKRVPLVLSLTSPAGRPIQTTRDLPAFWQGSWRDVQKDMRGRYPKHNWPDDPANASPSLATKKKQGI